MLLVPGSSVAVASVTVFQPPMSLVTVSPVSGTGMNDKVESGPTKYEDVITPSKKRARLDEEIEGDYVEHFDTREDIEQMNLELHGRIQILLKEKEMLEMADKEASEEIIELSNELTRLNNEIHHLSRELRESERLKCVADMDLNLKSLMYEERTKSDAKTIASQAALIKALEIQVAVLTNCNQHHPQTDAQESGKQREPHRPLEKGEPLLVEQQYFESFDSYILYLPSLCFPVNEDTFPLRPSTQNNANPLFRWPLIPGPFDGYKAACLSLENFSRVAYHSPQDSVRLAGLYSYYLQTWLLRPWGRRNVPRNIKLNVWYCNPNKVTEKDFGLLLYMKVRDECSKERKILNEIFQHQFLEGIEYFWIDQDGVRHLGPTGDFTPRRTACRLALQDKVEQ